MNAKPNLDDIKLLHHAGRLQEARSGYLTLLETNPDDIEVLHLLGLLCAEEGNQDEARTYLGKALLIAPEHAGLRLHLANILKAAGSYDDAVREIQCVIAADAQCAPAYNNLGTIYFARKQYDLAAQSYHVALDIRPDYADAYYNLGLAEARRNHDDDAIAAYRALISLAPDHGGAHFQLGCLLMKRRQLSEAANEFQAVRTIHPHHFESLANLAACRLQQGKMDEAAALYFSALELTPEDRDTLFNLGVIHMQQGYARDAVNFYLRTVKVDPDFYEAHHNLGAYYLMARQNESALLHYREALRIRPDDEASRHMIRVLTQDPDVEVSAPAYIESLFDSYADYYDAHMVNHLQYQVPDQLYNMVKNAGLLASGELNIIDIGCGTGLCGEVFKPNASRLIGIDLSQKMLEIAAQKKIYDELISTDISPWLMEHPAEFDLALAGDVLVYFGKLEELMAAVAQCLKPGGHFAFNVETGASGDFMLMPSGRFCHHKNYLQKLARDYGFTVLAMDPVALRRHESGRAAGYVCLWQRRV